ncbi:MAG: TonB-dependent receptor plug domain-containing protein [Saprospiraceae bacterium]|nr:TonB-dependent receptor plug domain-containing protein [Saprospiraceae bacterium]NNL91431.1 TonB-dependent receptor plug domain-containing protein [Saprospiraceae bacterium]
MIKKFTFFILCLFFSGIAFSQTTIQGKITEEATGDAVLFATVALYKNDVLMQGTESDFDGNYSFSDIDPGTYDIEISFLTLQTQRINGVVAKAGKVNKVDVVMKEESVLIEGVEIVDYKVPLVEFDNTTQGKALTSENIQALPTKNIGAIAATSAGVSLDNNGNISVRGSRTNSTYYYIDGIRVSSANANNLVPQAQIEQMQIITGGIEARYGDVTGGIISITTRGPSNKYSGGVELETSEFLDAYGYNLVNANVSGPIIKNDKDESVFGFRAFGQYRKIQDDSPSAVGVYRASESLINRLEAEPTALFNGITIPATELVSDQVPEGSDERVNRLDAAPNEADRDYNMGLNLDARIGKIDLTLSGTYYDSKNQFTPSRAWGLYNWTNNPYGYSSGFRSSIRLRHKLGNQTYGEGEEKKDAVIRNASYSIQFGYEKGNSRNEDVRHEDRIFNYGYWGNQARDWQPAIGVIDTSDYQGEYQQFGNFFFGHVGYQQIDGEFTPGEANPVLARINNVNGFFEPVGNGGWGLYNNVGRVYNTFSKSESETYTVNVSSGFDFVPGGSDKGKHNIQFGFMYEQRVRRNWSINPTALWTLMRTQVNRHIEQGIDPNQPLGLIEQPGFPDGTQFQSYAPLNNEAEFGENTFFRNVRNITGDGITDFVNVDQLDPNMLSLGMFSPSELNAFRQVGLNYFGYDYEGNKTSGAIGFDDLFNERDGEGRRTLNVAPFQPIYGAGYIQDKFTFKDIIFRLGLRVDYYDANTKVLKDPFTLSQINTVDEFFKLNPDIERPDVPDDYAVYVEGEGSNQVKGFRSGDDWFLPDGTATDGNLLFGGGLVFPSYVESDPAARDLKNENYNPERTFKDYDPQLNFMPRLAFSFPISESAGFFAHYDVLVERPTSNTVATSLNYFNFNETFTGGFNNPDLKPQKTIDYEVGFQQKISNSSAIKVSAYYKELRDLIQQRIFTFVPSPITQYQSYANIDFGTVKGFSFNYDMRRTGNFELSMTYTLQFADGSGSDANSSGGLNQRGDIRTLLPLSFDERHRITAVADYRFSSGKNYDGPRIGTADILANTGFNLLFTTVSGRPYSTFKTVTGPLGVSQRETINGARLPWQINADFQVDKNFTFKLSEESKRSLGLNVYLRVSNLFDIRNVVGVYRASDDPEDEGYLTNEFGEQRINQITESGFDVQSFLSHYGWRTTQPGFYTRPRQIFLGAIFNF